MGRGVSSACSLIVLLGTNMNFKKNLFPNRMWMTMDQMILFHLPLIPSCPPRKREEEEKKEEGTSFFETIGSKGWTSGSQKKKDKPPPSSAASFYAFIIWDQSLFISFQNNTFITIFFVLFFLPGLYFPLTQVSLNHCHDQVTLKYIQAKCGHRDLEEVIKTSFYKDEESKHQAQSFIRHLDFIFPNSQRIRNWRHLPLLLLMDLSSPYVFIGLSVETAADGCCIVWPLHLAPDDTESGWMAHRNNLFNWGNFLLMLWQASA